MARWTERGLIAACLATLASAVGAQEKPPERGTKMVPERPGRVFVMAGFDDKCQSLTPVVITIEKAPEKGTISFRDNQDTTIQYSLSGRCIGAKLEGTGIYYTARAGTSGLDTFSVKATLGKETATRTFTVRISDE